MRTSLLLLTVALLGLLISGCTVIGIVAGASADRSNARPRHATWSDVRAVPRGRQVEVILTSGDTLRGKFTGLRALHPNSYRMLYENAGNLSAGDSLLPPLGETVSVVHRHERPFKAEFCGFEAEALVVRLWSEDTLFYQPLSNTSQMKNYHGKTYDIKHLLALASGRLLPSRREFTLQSGGQTQPVPLECIQEVYAEPKYTDMWLVYGAKGLVVDVIVILGGLLIYAQQVTGSWGQY
jgi:hypothetical protein